MIQAPALSPEFADKSDEQAKTPAQSPSQARQYQSDYVVAREYGGTQYADAVTRGQKFEISS